MIQNRGAPADSYFATISPRVELLLIDLRFRCAEEITVVEI
jgi:hypothetical protein